jgi:hypothetical protein
MYWYFQVASPRDRHLVACIPYYRQQSQQSQRLKASCYIQWARQKAALVLQHPKGKWYLLAACMLPIGAPSASRQIIKEEKLCS